MINHILIRGRNIWKFDSIFQTKRLYSAIEEVQTKTDEAVRRVTIKKLIVNADDFGLHESINAAIIAAHRHGCVTSASIVAGGKAFEDAVKLARKCPGLGIGVHLTLVGLRPLTSKAASSLITPDGCFFSDYEMFARAYLKRRIKPEHIETELHRQLQKAVESGIKISHLDSHQHLHVLPGLPPIIGRLARAFRITKIRLPAEPFFFCNTFSGSVGRVLSRTVLTGCAHWARRQYQAQGIRSPDHFYGMLSGGRSNQRNLLTMIDRLPEGISEIMVHPGLDNVALNRELRWDYQWQEELAALQSTEVLARLKKRQIELIDYHHI